MMKRFAALLLMLLPVSGVMAAEYGGVIDRISGAGLTVAGKTYPLAEAVAVSVGDEQSASVALLQPGMVVRYTLDFSEGDGNARIGSVQITGPATTVEQLIREAP